MTDHWPVFLCTLSDGGYFLTTAVAHYAAAAVTDRGRKRPTNEDAFGFSVEHGVYVVCDGMGGAAAGEIASSLAVDEMMRLLTTRDAQQPLSVDAEHAVSAANQAIYTRAQRSNKLNGMGTTLVSLIVEERRAWILNVGDSRGYRLRDSHLEQSRSTTHWSKSKSASAAWTAWKRSVHRSAT